MQVRYQTAPRSDTIVLLEIESRGSGNFPRSVMIRRFGCRAAASAAQDLHQILELDPHLLDDLLALRDIRARLFAP